MRFDLMDQAGLNAILPKTWPTRSHGNLSAVNNAYGFGNETLSVPSLDREQRILEYPLTWNRRGKTVRLSPHQRSDQPIAEIQADGEELEFMSSRSDKEPFKLEVRRLLLDHVGENGPIFFRAALLNTEPPGEIRSTGQFGPWNADEPGSTPVSGSYTFEDANLGVFEGIEGTLSSRGKFSGTLEHIETQVGPTYRTSTFPAAATPFTCPMNSRRRLTRIPPDPALYLGFSLV